MTVEIHNLDVQDELEIKEFLKRKNKYDNHMHLFPDIENRELHIFLHIGEAGSGKAVKTTVENVQFTNHYETEREGGIANWFLTGSEADNVFAFLNCLKWERTETSVTLTWREEAGRPMMEDSNIGEEFMEFKYRTESGKEERVSISSVYDEAAKSVQMMANFK